MIHIKFPKKYVNTGICKSFIVNCQSHAVQHQGIQWHTVSNQMLQNALKNQIQKVSIAIGLLIYLFISNRKTEEQMVTQKNIVSLEGSENTGGKNTKKKWKKENPGSFGWWSNSDLLSCLLACWERWDLATEKYNKT